MTPKVIDSWGLSACGDIFTAPYGIGIYFGLIGAPKQVTTQAKPKVARFGVYEFAHHAQELRKAGIRLRLEGQPLAILQMLLERLGNSSRARSCRKSSGQRTHLSISNTA